MSQRGQTSIKRPWVTALVAIVAVVSAAALVHAIARERSAVPTAAPSSSTPAPASSYVKDDKQTTCDKIDAARRDFLTVLEQANPVLDNPDSTPAEIQEQADKLLTALEALGTVVLLAAVRAEDETIKLYAFHYGADTDDIQRVIRMDREDAKTIRNAVRASKFEQYVVDLCLGRPISPPSR